MSKSEFVTAIPDVLQHGVVEDERHPYGEVVGRVAPDADALPDGTVREEARVRPVLAGGSPKVGRWWPMMWQV